jgi:hypothetical protein
MRTACEMEADLAITMMPLLSRLGGQANVRLLFEIMERFVRGGDRSRFGLINAVSRCQTINYRMWPPFCQKKRCDCSRMR